jgi:hypothetical protein
MTSWPFPAPKRANPDDPEATKAALAEPPKPEPSPRIATYMLARDAQGRQVVSVHVKRCYKLQADGRCKLAEQHPLLMRPKHGTEDEAPFHETDIVPFKVGTDLIVMAHAHGHGRTQVEARIRVGRFDVVILVSGDRRCIYRGPGSIEFEPPQPFDKIPLRYEHAYGGFDDTVPDPPVEHLEDLMNLHPGLYPRNHVGRGYVVYDNPARIDGLLLPNLEHPQQRLRPSGLITGGPEHWHRQPLPWSCDWFDKNWYPRIAHYGGLPDHVPEDDRQLPEVLMGRIDPDQVRRWRSSKVEDLLDPRLGDAAAPQLVLPWLRGDEAIELSAMTPEGQLLVALPGQPPRMQLRYDREVHELKPLLDRVLISTDEMGVYLVWKGLWHTPHELPDRYPDVDFKPGDELAGVEAFVDGEAILPLDVP